MAMSLLEDFISGDTSRVLRAAWEVRAAESGNNSTLSFLI